MDLEIPQSCSSSKVPIMVPTEKLWTPVDFFACVVFCGHIVMATNIHGQPDEFCSNIFSNKEILTTLEIEW
jgi:hypothetical protein